MPTRIVTYRAFLDAPAPDWLLRRSDVTDGAKLTYTRLRQYAGKGDFAFPYLKTLAAELGKPAETVRRHVAELVRLGLIESERRGNGSPNRFHFLDHPWIEYLDGSPTDHVVGVQSVQQCTLERASAHAPSINTYQENVAQTSEREDEDLYSIPHWKTLLGSFFRPLTLPQRAALRRIEEAYLTRQADLFALMDVAALKDRPLAWLLAVAPTRLTDPVRRGVAVAPPAVDYDAFAREIAQERSRHDAH